MIKRILITSVSCLGVGFLAQIAQRALQTEFLNNLLQNDLIQLQIALLAINSATLGVVLTRIRDLIEQKNVDSIHFREVRKQMLLSIREQITLIAMAIITLTVWPSSSSTWSSDSDLMFGSITCAIFIYSLSILYDTAKSILKIIDFQP